MLVKSVFLVSIDQKQSLKTNLRKASRRFEKSFGITPNTFIVNPSLARRDIHFGNLHIVRAPTMLTNMVGVKLSSHHAIQQSGT